MKKISEIILPNEYMYTNEHIWIKKDNDSFLVGISDFAQDQLGEIVFIELPEIDTSYDAEKSFGEVESVKSVNQLFMPVAGTIVEINSVLEDNPTLLNTDCYNQAWVIRITIKDETELKKLFSAEKYREFLNS